MTAHLELSKSRRRGEEQRPLDVDFPSWMVESIDREAERPGVTRQSIIEVRITKR